MFVGPLSIILLDHLSLVFMKRRKKWGKDNLSLPFRRKNNLRHKIMVKNCLVNTNYNNKKISYSSLYFEVVYGERLFGKQVLFLDHKFISKIIFSSKTETNSRCYIYKFYLRCYIYKFYLKRVYRMINMG